MSAEATPIAFGLDGLGVGGTELNAVRLAERLDHDRFALHLFVFRGRGPLRQRFEAAGVRIHELPIRRLWGTSAITAGRRLRRLIREHGIRLLHAHDLYSSIHMVPWAQSARPRPATIASRRWWHPPSRGLGTLGRLALPFADRLLVNAPSLARRAIQMEGAQPHRVVVIPNFLDDERMGIVPEEQRLAIRAEFGIPPDALVIGMVARLDPTKDHPTLLHAFAAVSPRVSNAHLLLVGDGPQGPLLRQMAHEMGLDGRVTFAGERSNATNLHSASDVAVLCSLHEGFPNSLVEAMAAALPVVATGVGGNVDAVHPGETGLLVPVGDSEALAGALTTLLRDPQLRQRMGRAGLARARRDYGRSTVVPRLETLYESLLDARSRIGFTS